MPDFYVPKTKRELVDWIKRGYLDRGQCVAGLERKPVKQLYAIFYQLRREFDDRLRNSTKEVQQAH